MKTETIADSVKETILRDCPTTFSLYSGYGVEGGEYVYFPNGRQVREKRNDRGQCTFAIYKYEDKSTLGYKYHQATDTYLLTTRTERKGV